MGYLRCHLKTHPQTLEIGQDYANVTELTGDLNECLQNTRLVFDQIRFLKRDIAPLLNTPQHTPSNEIPPTDFDLHDEDSNSKRGKNAIITGALIVATSALVLAFKLHRTGTIYLI